jgi:hypothetical protein
MTITMIIITVILSPASATRQYACDEDAARALKRPWAPVVFHGERETESLPEIDARFTPDGDADEAAGFRAVDAFNEMEPIPALGKAYVGWLSDKPGSLIRFRVQTAEQLSITYLASFANFGPFRVWAGGEPHSLGAVSVEVDGRRDRFSLPRVARFPSTSELMRALRRSGGSLWIENAGAADGPSRVKILGVVSADCH